MDILVDRPCCTDLVAVVRQQCVAEINQWIISALVCFRVPFLGRPSRRGHTVYDLRFWSSSSENVKFMLLTEQERTGFVPVQVVIGHVQLLSWFGSRS